MAHNSRATLKAKTIGLRTRVVNVQDGGHSDVGGYLIPQLCFRDNQTAH